MEHTELSPRVSNADFLRVIFGDVPPDLRMWVNAGHGDPTGRDGNYWNGVPYRHGEPTPSSSSNAYYSIATFRSIAAPGEARATFARRKANFSAAHVVVIDDAGAIPPGTFPTYVMQTGPQTRQIGFALAVPCEDAARIDRIMRVLSARRIIDGDSQGNNAVRYVRLPEGTNAKAKYGTPHSVHLIEWHPDRRTAIEDIERAFRIDDDAPRQADVPDTGERADIAEATKRIAEGTGLHSSINTIAASLVAKGTPPGSAIAIIRGIMDTSRAKDDRPVEWKHRYDDIPRSVSTAVEKFAKPDVEREPGADESEDPRPNVASREIEFMDVERMARTTAPPFKWLAHHLLPANVEALMSAHGGTRKSFLMLQLAVAGAFGEDFLGATVEKFSTLYICCEDDDEEVHRRLEVICSGYGRTIADLSATGRIAIIDGSGEDDYVIFRRDRRTNLPGATVLFSQIAEECERLRPTLVIADGVSDLFDGDELSNTDPKRFMRMLRALVRPQRGTVVAIGHVNRATAEGRGDGEAFRGAASWHNGPRCRIEWLHPETLDGDRVKRKPDPAGRMIWKLAKVSGHPPVDEVAVIIDPVRRIFVRDGGEAQPVAATPATHRRAILRALAECHRATPEVRVNCHGGEAKLKARACVPATLSRAAVKRFLDDLQADGKVAAHDVPKGDGKTVTAWRLTPSGWSDAGEAPPAGWSEAPRPAPRGRPRRAENPPNSA